MITAGVGSIDITFVFFVVIAVSLLFFMLAETRLSFRYGKSLAAWKEIKSLLSHGHEEIHLQDKSAKLINLIHQYFLVGSTSTSAEEGKNKVLLARSNTSYLVTVPVGGLVPHQPSSPYRFVPALLATIGVLGTFLGISLGLADFQTEGGNSAQLMSSATKLLSGMKTAFYTSLAGLSASIVFMAWHAVCSKLRERRYRSLTTELQELCVSVSPTSLLYNMNSSNHEDLIIQQLKATETVAETNKELLSVMKGVQSVLKNFDSETISKSVTGAVSDSIETTITPYLKFVSDCLKEGRTESLQRYKDVIALLESSVQTQKKLAEKQIDAVDATNRSNQQLAYVVSELGHVFDKFDSDIIANSVSNAVSQTVEHSISPYLAKIGESIKELREIKEQSAKDVVDLIVQSLREEVIEPFALHVTRTIEKADQLTLVSERYSASVESLVHEMHGLMSGLDQTAKSLNQFQLDTLTRLEKFADSLRSILSQFKNDTEGTLKQIAVEIQSALDNSVRGMESQRSAFQQSAQNAAAAFAEQNESLKGIGRESSVLMQEAKDNLLEGLSNIDDKVKSMSLVTQQELERFRLEYQKNLQEFFSMQANLLESTLGQQREGLADVVEDFRVAFKEENELRKQQYLAIDQQYTQLKDGVALVEELVEAVGMNKAGAFSQLEDASMAISAQVGKLRQSYEEAAVRFNKITEQMPEAMTDYFERANTSHVRFFDNFDEAAAKVHGKLADAANLLVTAMQQIEMQLVEEKVN
ncbi:hypothetical protein DN062_03610 [Nitrincola tibetensis]|uniref:Uncharacterized protein n=1 Tax=Nitrincola tibetensis TaxID=2219697 RepID=A0A364NQH9_9GAMM|nr:MotA/TolQ/ExbB proton channel family protein [Nitrincola tibetensis]RAU19358.1 hypothetical protein DN062_03610 [Nitrincola tibetensis]